MVEFLTGLLYTALALALYVLAYNLFKWNKP
jgi:hypothetical protein